MSLLNRMLRDLDARRGAGPALPDLAGASPAPVAALPRRGLGRFWVAGLMGVLVMVVGLGVVIEHDRHSPRAVTVVVHPVAPASAPQSPPWAARERQILRTHPAPHLAARRVHGVGEPVARMGSRTPPTLTTSASFSLRAGEVHRTVVPPTRAAQAAALEAGAAQSLREGRPDLALEALNEAVTLAPDRVSARLALATVAANAGDRVTARRVLAEGMSRDPREPRFPELAARLAAGHGDVAGAVALLSAHRAMVRPSAGYFGLLAGLEVQAGENGQAVADYHKALTLAPRDGRDWAGLGVAQNALVPGQGNESFRRALNDPNLSVTLRRYLLAQLGEADPASH